MFIFMLGFIFGGFFGMFLICLMQICRADRDIKTAREYREEIKTFREYIAGMEDVVNMYEKFFEEELENESK